MKIIDNLKDLSFFDYYGVNLLKGITPKVTIFDGRSEGLVRYVGYLDDKYLDTLTSDEYYTNNQMDHLDIENKNCTFLYDIGECKKIDRILIAGYYNPEDDYSIEDYEVYISDSFDELFNHDNLIVHYKNENGYELNSIRNNTDQVYEVDGISGRYFAMKVNSSNRTDDILRISKIGLFNFENDRNLTYYKTNFEDSCISGLSPIKYTNFDGNLNTLTDGVCFNDNKMVSVLCGATVSYQLENEVNIHSLSVVAQKNVIENTSVFAWNNLDELYENAVDFKVEYLQENAAKIILNKCVSAKFIGFKFETSGKVYELGCHTDTRYLTVDTEKIITEDFIGFGVNCLPMNMMEESVSTGYNIVHWELEKRRIINTKPKGIRLWFQPDWVITTKKDFDNGIYDFDSAKMKAVYYYLDAFKEADCEIELNFGWKTAERIQDWFCLDVPRERRAAAPADLEGFARCCSATVKELVAVRGYDNIKYLSFFNESSYACYSGAGDFILPDRNPKEYYVKMFKAVVERMKKDDTAKFIKFWGGEQSGNGPMQLEWTKLMTDSIGEDLDVNTHHRYHYSYDELMKFFNEHKQAAKGGKVIISEYGVFPEITDWDHSHMSYSMAVHNSGYNGAMLWTMNGVYITEPMSFIMDNTIDLWGYPTKDEGGIERVRFPFYDTCLQMQYIPAHSKSILTKTSNNDVRIAAWVTPDGDYTVLYECKESKNGRDVIINFDKPINKTFYKHVYKKPYPMNANATVIPSSAKIKAHEKIIDNLDSDYQMVMYTTIKPIEQIELDKIEQFLLPNESTKFVPKLIDATGEVEWLIASATTEHTGTITQDGVYTADALAKSGDMIAVRVQLKSNPKAYQIGVITIK